VEFDAAPQIASTSDAEVLAVDDALKALAKIDGRKSQVVELRFFAGLSIEETAEVLQFSSRTVKRDWIFAKAWLLREMAGHGH
jgi:RNA polymerase sigma factor (TIGR02999 family)